MGDAGAYLRLMAGEITARERRRAAGLAAVVALHAVILAVLLHPAARENRVTPAVVMTVRAVPAPAPPLPAAPSLAPVPVAMPVADEASEVPPAPPPCAIPAMLAPALAAGGATPALAPLVAVPERALMIWNGRWLKRPEAQPLRAAIVAALASSRAECLDEAQIGPRLIVVGVGETTIAIGIGSGSWTWRQLLSFDDEVGETSGMVPVDAK